MLHRLGHALFILLVLTCLGPEAWATKVGPEFRVNTSTTGRQGLPRIAKLNDGGFVVIWGAEGALLGVYGQRYSAAGARVGGEFKVNTFRVTDFAEWSVAGLNDGGFVIAWTSKGQDGSYDGVYARRYNAAGARVGGEFRVNTHTAGDQWGPSIARLNDGGFVITWTSRGQDGSRYGIYGQRYSAAGAKVGSEFRVNTYIARDQKLSSVAALSGGGYVVIWTSDGQDGSGLGVYGQRYSASGARAGGEFRINSSPTHNQFAAGHGSVAALGDGGFVVTWFSDAPDGSAYTVYARRYSAAGTAIGNEFRIGAAQFNTQTPGYGFGPSIAVLSDGSLAITWHGYKTGSAYDVYALRYIIAGAPIGSGFRVNTTTAHDQWIPSILGLNNGSFVVTWTSDGQDGSGWGIYGQRFSP